MQSEAEPRKRPAAPTLCPQARKSVPVRKGPDGRRVIDTTTYIPYFLVSVNNPLSRGASQHYLKKFGIGIVEWRVVSMLATEPGIQASRICSIVSLDKGATSRALTRLNELGHTRYESSPTDPRKRVWWLNDRGYELHDKLIASALERERELIEGIDPDDLEAFLRAMRIMRRNVEQI